MHASPSAFDSQEFRSPVASSPARSIEYRFDPERSRVTVTLAGDISIDALGVVAKRVTSDAMYSPDVTVCIECRVVTSLPSDEDIRSLALKIVANRALEHQGRIAIVAMTARSYEAASLFELYVDAPPDRLAVFTDAVQARHWLAPSG